MVDLLQKAMDFGLSWIATIALAYYVYYLNKTHNEYIKQTTKEHKDETKEITQAYTEKVERITENYTTEVAKLRESVDNNTHAFKALYDILISKLD